MAALTPARVLCVAPDAALEPPAGVERSLQAALGGVACHLSYAQALGLFGKPSPFGKVLRGPPRHAVPAKALVQATVFLLQRRALVALHTYVHCVAEPLPPSEPCDSGRGRACILQPEVKHGARAGFGRGGGERGKASASRRP